MSINRDLVKIADYYGLYPQLHVTQEEAAELIVAISKFAREPDIREKEAITEELADLQIMIDQICYLLDIYDTDIESYKTDKIARQIGRIRAELALNGTPQEEINARFNK